MFRVEAPLRISMPGHSTSGADGVGECGCAVPGFAPEKKLATFAVQVGELSSVEDEVSTPDTFEQPATRTPAANHTSVFPPRMRLLSSPHATRTCCVRNNTSQTMAPAWRAGRVILPCEGRSPDAGEGDHPKGAQRAKDGGGGVVARFSPCVCPLHRASRGPPPPLRASRCAGEDRCQPSASRRAKRR